MRVDEAAAALGVDRDISADDLKSVYRRLAIKWHPDKCKDVPREEATAKFQTISRAYKCLEAYIETGEGADSEEESDGGDAFDPSEMMEAFEIFEMMFAMGGGGSPFGGGGRGGGGFGRGGGRGGFGMGGGAFGMGMGGSPRGNGYRGPPRSARRASSGAHGARVVMTPFGPMVMDDDDG